MRFLPLAALCATTLVATAVAQGNLIGCTRGATGGDISRQLLCRPHVTVCGVDFTLNTPSGGAAYNPYRASVFYTDGRQIREVDPNDRCRLLCTINARQIILDSRVAGLTFNPGRSELYALETRRGIAVIHTYRWDGRCLTPVSACRVTSGIPSSSHVGGGIAYDRSSDSIWIVMSPLAGGPGQVLLGFQRANPCTTRCQIALPACGRSPLGFVTALTIDSCANLMYASDGRQVATYTYNGSCRPPTPLACCPALHPDGNLWFGFDVEPGAAVSRGGPCLNRPCPSCPNWRLGEVGRAQIGNAGYGFRLTDGPAGFPAALIVNFGPCTVGTPILGCVFYPSLSTAPLNIGSTVMTGAACGGTGSFRVPVPPNYALCGRRLCFQAATICISRGAAGLGLTNALNVRLQ